MPYYGNEPIRFGGVSMITASLGINDPQVGARTRDGDEEYIFVQNVGSSTANIGHGVVVSAVSGYSVTVSSTTSADFCIGVVKHSGLATGEYGWIVTKGFVDVEMITASGTVAAGDLIHMAADGEFAPVSNATGSKDNVVGKAMAAIVSGASGTAYINVL